MRMFLAAVALMFMFGLSTQAVSADPPPEGQGRLTIHQDTHPETNNVEFDYDFDPGSDFDLEDDQSLPKNLVPGQYEIQQIAPPGWKLTSVVCDLDVLYSVDIVTSTLVIDMDADDDDVNCEFNNELAPTPTPVPTATPVPTPPEPQIVYQPIFIPAPQAAPQQVIVERVVERAPAPVAAKPATSAVRPPSTGDGGIR